MNASLPILLDALKMHGIFWMFSGVVIANGVNAYLFMPETKDLSLEQIQEKYYRNKEKKGDVE